MTELFSNLGQTTINQIGGIGATDTTVVVSALNGSNSWNSFPSSGNFRVIFGTDSNSEIALCTAVNTTTNTFTIVRGQEGSAGQAWANGTTVTIALTAQALNQARADVFQVGPYSNRPATGLPTGSYYQATDGRTPWIWNPVSGAWAPQISGVLGIQPLLAGTFTAINTTTNTLTDDRGTLYFQGPSDGGSVYRGYAYSFTGPGFVEAAVSFDPAGTTGGGDSILGISMVESSTQKVYQFDLTMQHNSTTLPVLEIFSGYGNRTAAASYPQFSDGNGPIFLRIRVDTVNIYADLSRDRIIWKNMDSHTITNIFTTAPNFVGISGYGNGTLLTGHILHFISGIYPTVSDQVFTPNIHNLRSQIFMPPPNPPAPTIPVGWVGPILNH